MSGMVQRFRDPGCPSVIGGGEPCNNASLLARWDHSYPAEQDVPDQDASCRANRLGMAGPIFGDGSQPRPAPVARHPRPIGAPQVRPRRSNFVAQAAFTRAPSGISPAVTYLHKATSSFLAKATAVILRIRPRAAPTRSVNQRASVLSGW